MTLIVSVVGARPQFVKASVVCRALAGRGIPGVVIHTGQHYDGAMSHVFFSELELPAPAYNLEVGSGPHGVQTARMMERLEPLLSEFQGATVLVYGDTNSTLAAAVVAAKLPLRLAHVEAGLRSFNRRMPEEVNRVATDHLSDVLFAPTDGAVENLSREGLGGGAVHRTGDVMYDAALVFRSISDRRSDILDKFGLASGEYILGTIHRAENTDDPERFSALIDGFMAVAREMQVVLPLHPRSRKRLEDVAVQSAGLHVVDPVGYLDMIALERHAALIATDSGGVQKEAFFYGIPCVTLRRETEWVELVELGWNRLVYPLTADDVSRGIMSGLGTKGIDAEPYGDGHAADFIAEILGTEVTS